MLLSCLKEVITLWEFFVCLWLCVCCFVCVWHTHKSMEQCGSMFYFSTILLMKHACLLCTFHIHSEAVSKLLSISYCTAKNSKKDLCSLRKVRTISSILCCNCHRDLKEICCVLFGFILLAECFLLIFHMLLLLNT